MRRSLDLAFDVQTTDAELGRYLDHVLAAYPSGRGEGTRTVRFGFAEVPGLPGDPHPTFVVRRAHRTVRSATHPSTGFNLLLTEINRATVRAAQNRVLVHSGLVAFGARAIMVVGVSGAGKSSLTGMLCVLGARYGTDELVALDPTTGALEGARRPIVLKPSAPRALVERLPPVHESERRYLDLVRPIALADLGALAMNSVPSSVSIVFVRFRRDAPPAAVEPTHRADAAAALFASCWNRRRLGPVAFEAVVDLVRHAEVAAMEFSDIVAAAHAIRDRFA